jgi:hypothetical protein
MKMSEQMWELEKKKHDELDKLLKDLAKQYLKDTTFPDLQILNIVDTVNAVREDTIRLNNTRRWLERLERKNI